MGIGAALLRTRDGHQATIRWQSSLCVFACVLILALPREAVAVPNLRGVATQDERYYQTAIIKCKDGTKSFPQERLNDDFCDCVDGTDEPGTNACPEAKFTCKNLGHKPVTLFSSRVNDGICDCCDGSDEYDGKIKCPNTCWESGKQSREKLKKKYGTFKDGSAIRKRDVEAAQILRQQHEYDLVQLKSEEKILKDIVAKLKVEKEAVEKAEKQHREEMERREKEEQKRREMEKAAALEGAHLSEKETQHSEEEAQQSEDVAQQTEEAPQQVLESARAHEAEEAMEAEEEGQEADEEGQLAEDAAEQEPEPLEVDPISTDGSKIHGLEHLSEAERGRVIASRWTGEDVSDIISKREKHLANEGDLIARGVDMLARGNAMMKEAASLNEGDIEDDEDLNYEEPIEDIEDDDYDISHALQSDTATTLGSESNVDEQSSWWSRLSNYVLRPFHLNKPAVDISEADRIRKEYQESSSKLQAIEAKIADLEKRTKQDFGKEGQFYSFYDQCFEYKEKKYIYKVCPYKEASQVEGHSTTRLGRWQGFKEDYKELLFPNGDKCWNGPERSLRVKMRCGTKLELRSVDEPSRCEYVAELSTPALCLESKVQALAQQLSEKEPQWQTHDEL